MTKTIDDYFKAAEALADDLLGEDATPREVEGALAKLCEEWAKSDQENVAILASHLARYITGWIDCTIDLPRVWMMRSIHFGCLAERIDIYLGRQEEYSKEVHDAIDELRKRWPYREPEFNDELGEWEDQIDADSE
jgi:hypothetical protein